ncbi:dimethylsulfonioproprionate lyase family protein [Pseudohalocynthiibacter aestuariivivens]|jgi:mannose-6-phosphate isomerase-like protein (cupin superfamily)|uniref:Dimethylsulfonioproprionate lyase family protein n=1 Tax=Pseudohalocynthiibacter aestuariivivens TaxID=1591409 RepID=A0ABV5JM94_9RHOB|nr:MULTISPECIES: dimethylsulfonioproprionate lyase family protein [Pseudohalocynthiibacter]MBS9717707.1 cupin domain-containing protein [Pseudohalocynthiibacter aestuariivivens]MCK0102907.1 dimethylsulfonioproprionate lyase family protein [Pseudohalocynthiibacter sp. F2068]
MTHREFAKALAETATLHTDHPDVAAFCPFPNNVKWRELEPFYVPAAKTMVTDTGFSTDKYTSLRDALIVLWDKANWRKTYRGTNIGDDFLNRFGCYELVGYEGHFECREMSSFLVYSDAGLHYPWHHHPAEEMYMIIAGEALFEAEGKPSRVLGSGDTAFHASNQPHAMTTQDSPVLAYVIWRGEGMDTGPVLTERPVNE